MSRRGDPLKL